MQHRCGPIGGVSYDEVNGDWSPVRGIRKWHDVCILQHSTWPIAYTISWPPWGVPTVRTGNIQRELFLLLLLCLLLLLLLYLYDDASPTLFLCSGNNYISGSLRHRIAVSRGRNLVENEPIFILFKPKQNVWCLCLFSAVIRWKSYIASPWW